jgi:hypothetical protein
MSIPHAAQPYAPARKINYLSPGLLSIRFPTNRTRRGIWKPLITAVQLLLFSPEFTVVSLESKYLITLGIAAATRLYLLSSLFTGAIPIDSAPTHSPQICARSLY